MRYSYMLKNLKMFFAVLIVMLTVSTALGNPTEQLLKATEKKNITVTTIKRLIEAGADVNAREDDFGTTVLMKLLWTYTLSNKANLEAVNLLIKNGADVNAKNNYGTTALMCTDNYEIFKALMKAGADVHAKTDSGYNVLMAVAHQENPDPKIIKLLTEAGVNVNARDNEGGTALMYAVKSNIRPDFIRALTKAGANINIQDKYGFTPLMLAAGNCGRGDYYIGIDDNRNLEAVKILIKAGANLNVRDKEEGMTALMFALEGVVYEDGVEIAKALIKAGANVNIKDNEGKTALDYANQECEYRYEERAYGMNNENDLKLCEEIRNIIQDSMN